MTPDLRALVEKLQTGIALCEQSGMTAQSLTLAELRIVLAALASRGVGGPQKKEHDHTRVDEPRVISGVKATASTIEAIRCSVCDQEVPDSGDLVCVDCYDFSRRELPNPVTLTLSRDDCHALLGHLASQKGWLKELQVRFFDALEAASKVDAVVTHGTAHDHEPPTREKTSSSAGDGGSDLRARYDDLRAAAGYVLLQAERGVFNRTIVEVLHRELSKPLPPAQEPSV